MKKQFAVIGLGNFGFYLATTLYQKGHEVLAVDVESRRVQEIRDNVSRAVIADATDPKAVRELELADMDAVVIAMGSDLNNSILATLNTKDAGVKRILAKAVSDAHGRILQKIGASEIYFPEKDLALTAAQRLANPNIIDYIPLMEDHSIAQLAPPEEFLGKTLAELDLINKYGIQIVAVKELIPKNHVIIPTGRFVIKDSDVLVMIGPEKQMARLRELAS
ncbi:MAG: TrkA family potassium uptake protein [Desulfosarcinaceae bacterium]|jgi:trk system potassium uptake protein TrkA